MNILLLYEEPINNQNKNINYAVDISYLEIELNKFLNKLICLSSTIIEFI